MLTIGASRTVSSRYYLAHIIDWQRISEKPNRKNQTLPCLYQKEGNWSVKPAAAPDSLPFLVLQQQAKKPHLLLFITLSCEHGTGIAGTRGLGKESCPVLFLFFNEMSFSQLFISHPQNPPSVRRAASEDVNQTHSRPSQEHRPYPRASSSSRQKNCRWRLVHCTAFCASCTGTACLLYPAIM